MLPLLLVAVVGQPEPARLDQALKLVRPHLTWHAPVPPSRDDRPRQIQEEKRKEEDTPWQDALGAPQAWQGDIPRTLIDAVEGIRQAHPQKPEAPPLSAYPWRLKDPAHADIRQALALLDAVPPGPDQAVARRWAAELRRNNTVLTLDVAGAFAAGKRARVVLDARNADRVTLRLYRLGSAEDLLRVLDRIGTDFVFRSHDFDRLRNWGKLRERELWERPRDDREAIRLPEVLQRKPLAAWQQPLDRLDQIDRATLRYDNDLHWFSEEDTGHDDACHRHRVRLERSYLWHDNGFSSWRAGLILDIPAAHFQEPGAYLLQVEANGQFVLAPLLVDPPALTLRRCPDGVLAIVGDEGGSKPLAGATVQARKQVAAVTTDGEGVAFLRVYARGDRVIVAEHRSRFAVGGFGAVFAGIYSTPEDADRPDRKLRPARDRLVRKEALVYADGLVLALWTDRPVYRPGEEVHAKLIVRKRVPRAGLGFRAVEYDAPGLELLPEGTAVQVNLVDAEGKILEGSEWKLNDFGSAAGTFRLKAEAPRGEYRLRATIDDRSRLLPAVFQVDEFYRPAVAIEVTRLPAKLTPGRPLALTLTARHTGGLPVGRGTVTFALVGSTTHWNLTPEPIPLDSQGKARIEMTLPRHLPGERMSLQATVTEADDLRTTRAFPVEIESQAMPRLGRLPRFVAADQPIVWRIAAKEIELEQGRDVAGTPTFKTTRVPVVDGQAKFTFPAPGWYSVRAGDEELPVFAHGGTEPPWTTCTRRQAQALDEVGPWIDLAHYSGTEGGSDHSSDNRSPILALLGPQEGVVGGTLPVLVYVPFESARLFFTLEGHSVVDYFAVRVEGRASRYHVVNLPLRDRHRPHFYLQGTILAAGRKDRQPEQAMAKLAEREQLDEDSGEDPLWCKIAVIGPPPTTGVRVEIRTDRPEYEPGDRVTVDVRTLDAGGKPLATELALAVVDERLFAIAGDRLPAVLAAFTGTRGPERFQRKTWRHSPGVRPDHGERQQLQRAIDQAQKSAQSAELEQGESLRERLAAIPRPELGGLPIAVIPLAPPRTALRETAFWAPQIRTDAEGRARVIFDAPVNLTRYRVSALALARSGDLGTARTTFRVGKPLEVEAFLPPEMVVGPTLALPIQVRNATDRERRVTVMATLTGLERPGNPPPRTMTVTVPSHGAATIRLPVIARKEGAASVTVSAGDGAHDDAETRQTRVVQPKPMPTPAEPPAPAK